MSEPSSKAPGPALGEAAPDLPAHTAGARARGFSLALALGLLSALVLYIYLPTLEHGWAPLDDELNFTGNPHYRGRSADHRRWMATTRLAGHYIPLSWLTLAVDFELYGMDPRGYHRTNLLLHLINALLFFALASRLLERVTPGAPTARRLAAFLAAALFALHPLRVESVAWITERRDLLCGLFCLLSLHAYVRAAASSGRRRAVALAAAGVAFSAALLSKGLAIMLPVALLALDLGPLARLDRDPRRWFARPRRGVLLEKLPFLALAAIFAVVTFWAIGPVLSDRSQADLEHRLLSAGFGLSFYLTQTLLPVAIPFQVPAVHLLTVRGDPGVALSGLAFLALFGVAFAFWRRRPAPALALLVYAAFVLPVSGLFQAGPQLAAHRYTYLATLPIALLVAGAVALAARRLGRRGLAALGLVVLGMAALLAHRSRAQVGLWRDDVTFCSAAVAAAPEAWAPVGALARAHLDRGERREALAVLRAGRARLPRALLFPYLEALILATSPEAGLRDGSLALDLAARTARATSYQDPAALLALAAASAETGDVPGAQRALGAARALAEAGRKSELLPLLREVGRRIEARGVVRFDTADWRDSPL